MKVVEIDDKAERSRVCERVLRALPNWFGIEDAIKKYVGTVAQMQTLAAYGDDGELLGFLSLNYHFQTNAEIHVMGVLQGSHRQGVGRSLVVAAKAAASARSARFLSVKTLSPSREDKAYQQTRLFYEALGFLKFEELPNLWGPDNPCLEMILAL